MDQHTIDTYNKIAEMYDQETADFWQQFPPTLFDAFARELPQGKVLDVGSGPGRDGLMLQQRGFEVTCLDASHAMVQLSASRGLHSALGDFTDLPFADAEFDGVWAYTSLLHVPKAQIGAALQEVKRVLKPSGALALGLIEGSNELYRESAGVNLPRWFSFYTAQEVEELLHHHGFAVRYFEQLQPNKKKYLHFVAHKVAAV